MDAARWQQVCEVLDAVLAAEHHQRDGLIVRLCGDDRELRGEVCDLIAHSDRAADFLSECAPVTASRRLAEEEAALRLGAWKLKEMIGKGGMAVVYRAERDDGHFRKVAAAKILRFGVFGEEVLERFQRERQILADMDHPNIVKLLDGGMAPDGRPYLIMDLVDGVALDEYCTRQQLGTEERLALFLKVCDSVAYAHRHRVVHRDLKPRNILVTQAGEPRLLDFGIAKLLHSEPGEGETAATRFPFLTPGYASPEQARGLAASPASDQYSLAVILCELVSGHPPYDLRGLELLESLRAVCERPVDLHDVPAALKPVLERALSKQAAGRFETVAEFAEQVRRFGAGELRVAHPSRRRWSAGLLAGAAAAAVGGRWAMRPRGLTVSPVATGMLNHGFPSVSRDGETLSYIEWDSRGASIWLARRSGGGPRRLAELPGEGETLHTRISPDGRTLAFLSLRKDERFDVRTVDLLGGPIRTWLSIDGAALSWAPDSQWLAVCDRPEDGGPVSVFAHWLINGTKRRLSNPPAGTWGDIDVAASPDGSHLAVIRYSARGDGDVWLLSWNKPEERRLTWLHTWMNGLAFTPDGREVIFSPVSTPDPKLMRIGIEGGKPRSIPLRGMHPQLGGTAQAPVMVYTSHQSAMRLYRGDIRSGVIENRRLLLPMQQGGESPVHSADGSRLAWVDDRAVWSALVDGTQMRRLAAMDGLKRDLVWSPDGGTLALTAGVGNTSLVWTVDVASGRLQRLTADAVTEGGPVWSDDGTWIYWRSTRDGTPRFWRRMWRGGRPEAVSPPAVEGRPGPDGKKFYFLDNDQRSPLYESDGSGTTARRVEEIPPLKAGAWCFRRGALFYGEASGARETRYYMQRLGEKRRELVLTIGGTPPGLLRISSPPDLKEAVWAEWETESDVWLAEGFLE